MSDLQQAAERLRLYEHEDVSGGRDTYFGTNFNQFTDRAVLARAYLAEHPVDDGMPVDEGWLRSLGAVETHWGLSLRGGHSDVEFEYRDVPTVWRVNSQRYPADFLKTRRDVRGLCKALRIDLTPTEGTTE